MEQLRLSTEPERLAQTSVSANFKYEMTLSVRSGLRVPPERRGERSELSATPPPPAANEIDYITWLGMDYFWSMLVAILFHRYVTVISSNKKVTYANFCLLSCINPYYITGKA
jgi:hypothetical protein